MDDVKKTYREGEQNAKEAARRADGESLADDVGNVGDELNKQAGNLGDSLDSTPDSTSDTSKEAWRKADGDDSLADKIGNAGDDIRRNVDDPR
jgi:hypothetical protein